MYQAAVIILYAINQFWFSESVQYYVWPKTEECYQEHSIEQWIFKRRACGNRRTIQYLLWLCYNL